MHCSAVPRMFDVLLKKTCRRIPELYSSSQSPADPLPPSPNLCLLPSATARGYSSPTVLKDPHPRPPRSTSVTAPSKRIFGLAGIFLFQPFLLAFSRPPGAQSRVEWGQWKRKRTCYSKSCDLWCVVKSQGTLVIFLLWLLSRM